MTFARSDSRLEPRGSRREFVALVLLVAVFGAVPWLVQPLESLLPAVDVALAGEIAEVVLGVLLGAWLFQIVRRERRLATEYAREIERLTDSDALTGLGNMRALSRDLDRVLNRARRTHEPVTVVCVDVDAFDDVNRRHGRAVGDQTLRMMGAVVRSSVRFGIDAGYRLDGDQFAIVLTAARDAAGTVCRRLEWNFQERTPRRSSLSVGLATWDGRKSTEGLLEEARRALRAQRQTATVAQLA